MCVLRASAGKGEVLVQGPTYEFFCTKCARSIMESYGSMVQKKQKENDCKNEADAQQRANPSLIKDYLDEYIIEQDQAKKVLATAVYNHMLRIKMKKEQMEGADDIEKSNIIMIGPSGVGKTALIRRLAKAMNVPFVIEDITSFSSTGFVGRDVEAILRDLVDAAMAISKQQNAVSSISMRSINAHAKAIARLSHQIQHMRACSRHS